MENKNVLISVSYGALDNAALDADVGRVETAMLNALPGWQLSRAFTSARVCSLLSKRGKELQLMVYSKNKSQQLQVKF